MMNITINYDNPQYYCETKLHLATLLLDVAKNILEQFNINLKKDKFCNIVLNIEEYMANIGVLNNNLPIPSESFRDSFEGIDEHIYHVWSAIINNIGNDDHHLSYIRNLRIEYIQNCASDYDSTPDIDAYSVKYRCCCNMCFIFADLNDLIKNQSIPTKNEKLFDALTKLYNYIEETSTLSEILSQDQEMYTYNTLRFSISQLFYKYSQSISANSQYSESHSGCNSAFTASCCPNHYHESFPVQESTNNTNSHIKQPLLCFNSECTDSTENKYSSQTSEYFLQDNPYNNPPSTYYSDSATFVEEQKPIQESLNQ